jgi:hypothetical protein
MSTTEIGSSDLHTGLALLDLPGFVSRLFRSPRLRFKWEACRQMGIFYFGLAFPSVHPGSHGWLGAAARRCSDLHRPRSPGQVDPCPGNTETCALFPKSSGRQSLSQFLLPCHHQLQGSDRDILYILLPERLTL